MDVQLQSFIIDAFQHLSPFPQRLYLVIIDGLDECQASYWMAICLVYCRTWTVLSSMTVIPSFNIFVFADNIFLYWIDPMFFIFIRKFFY